jgi:hypothetical protein
VLANDSFMATPHATIGPHFHQHMVVRSDLKSSESKPQSPAGPMKDIPTVDSSVAGKNPLGRTGGSNSGIMMATSTPQMMLENRLRSLALELR